MNGAKKKEKISFFFFFFGENLLLSVKGTQADSCNLFLPN